MLAFEPLSLALAVFTVSVSLAPQTPVPVPFPRPGQPPVAAPQTPPVVPPRPAQPSAPGDPTEASLGVPLYPSAQFIASYDAGQGQRYYLFGTDADFVLIVTFYRTMLKQKGDLVFEAPPVHQFDIGRFREETMAFPPSVTVKDYTSGGSGGYLNPKRGAKPERFRTIIQVVPVLPGAAK